MSNPVDHGPVALVLGARVWAGGQASPSLRRRAEHAANLWLASQVRAIVACGAGENAPPSEAQVIKDICMAAGVPDGAIFLEDQSSTTDENIRFSRPLLEMVGAQHVMIVTDRYHAPRARLVARRLGLTASSASPKMPHPRFKFLWREALAYLWYAVKTKRE